MEFTRRNFGKLALATAAVPAGTLFAAKPNSKFDGVQIATITYSYRDRPELANDAHELLKLIVESGISAIELMPTAAERFAGAPLPPLDAGRGGGGAARGGARGGSGRGGGGGGRGRAMTPEQQAAAEKLKAWRLSASMDKFKEFRKLYNDAGVEIYCHKLTPTEKMEDPEFNYFFEVGKALGATQLSLELPEAPSPFTQRMGDTALKHGMVAAYHAHEQATETAWDAVLNQSKGNAVNLDTGHYYAGTGKSPVPAIIKYHERIASLHLKDRTPTTPQARGANLPWGQGSTPIVDILQTLKKNKYKFPAAIELEYQIPAGSDSVTEVKKCMEYCKKALESA
ncbi:MAG TPA: sugar phosphate isomerase/epimerase [Bryobacteraceae bacterium]|nr:sugar phosphate isomerase/epimerase [Bryobacteraceae bacterium]